jgi:hypothetical protein
MAMDLKERRPGKKNKRTTKESNELGTHERR